MEEKKVLTRDQILNADDLVVEEVDCPEWGGIVRVRTMTGQERDELEAEMFGAKRESQEVNYTLFRAKIAALTIVDQEGKRLFELEDVDELSKKSAKPLDRIFDISNKLSGFGKGDIEDITKNLSTGPSEDSISV